MRTDLRRMGLGLLIATLGNGGGLWLLSRTPDVNPPPVVPAMVVRLYPPFNIASRLPTPGEPHRRVQREGSSSAPVATPTPIPAVPMANGSAAMPSAFARPFQGLVGCSEALKTLRTDAEQTRCLQQWGRSARDQTTPERLAPIDPRKRADYDEIARRQAALKERTLPNPIVACTGPGSNFGLGCNAP